MYKGINFCLCHVALLGMGLSISSLILTIRNGIIDDLSDTYILIND